MYERNRNDFIDGSRRSATNYSPLQELQLPFRSIVVHQDFWARYSLHRPCHSHSRPGTRSGRDGPRQIKQQCTERCGAWIHIDEAGGVTAFTGKVEFGQNIRTSLTQVVAEELHVPISSVRMVMGDTELVPFDMGTFGSRTTPAMAPQLRKAAAAAREMLIAMAAEQLQVPPGDLRIVDARFQNPIAKDPDTRGSRQGTQARQSDS